MAQDTAVTTRRPKTRRLTIIAQDPSVRDPKGRILTAQPAIPYEDLEPGPRGYRVHVVDYDSARAELYAPADLGASDDRFAGAPNSALLEDAAFHAQNVYAIVMRLLARFEFALGRRVSWSFGGHQIRVAPHAFFEENAYYSEDDHGLMLGYFHGRGGEIVYNCLSHDIVAHETTHALVDGLRDSYTFPSHPDQAGFHEGFADTVALLSVFSLEEVVSRLLPGGGHDYQRISKGSLTAGSLRDSVLFGLAEQFGRESRNFHADSLRRAVNRPPDPASLWAYEFEESHLRGEVLSAALLNAFIAVWRKRLEGWLPRGRDEVVSRQRVVEDGTDAAEHLLTMCIRALDYCPVSDLSFGDFLSALLTADYELIPDDGKYAYRDELRKQFGLWGLRPASGNIGQHAEGEVAEEGTWEAPPQGVSPDSSRVHRESLQRDPDEVFRFLWENRKALGMYEDAYAHVISVRPCIRVGPDGFVLHETVSEYLQTYDTEARDLARIGIRKPDGMPDDTRLRFFGGGVLIFGDFGQLKYHVRSAVNNRTRQQARLDYLWRNRIRDRVGGRERYGFNDGVPRGQHFALMHLRRQGRLEKGAQWDA